MLYYIVGIIILLTLLSFIQKNKKETSNDPPQPLQLPLIGGLYLVDPKHPHLDIHKLSLKYGKMFKLWFGKNPCVFINDGDLYRDIYVTHYESFSDRPNLPSYNVLVSDYKDISLAPYPKWKPRREFLMGALSKTRLKSLNAILDTQVDGIVRKLGEYKDSGEPVNPRLIFRKYTTNIILSLVFNELMPYEEGLEEGFMGKIVAPIDRLMFRLAANSIFDHIYGFGSLYYYITKIMGTEVDVIKKELKQFYVQHLNTIDRKNPRDILDLLIIEGYGEDLILNITLDFLVAGSETSATAMEWFMLLMVNNPEVADKAYKELHEKIGRGNKVTVSHRQSTPYFQAVIKEVFRYKTIGPIGPLFREAKEDMTIQDYFIKKGTIIMANIYSIHRNESVYKDPNRFNPDRFIDSASYANHWAPFALGPRNCIGMSIAMDEIYVACASILLNYTIKSHNGQSLDETEIFGTVVKPNLHLYKFESR